MFKCDYKTLKISFNEFQSFEDHEMPEDDDFCLLELKDGGCTAGKWMPDGNGPENAVAGKFIRGTGDYKVNVQAGNRSTGGNREFFITPDCFEAKTYDEFLDRYLQIVPGGSFGLSKEDLLPDEKLKSFFGY